MVPKGSSHFQPESGPVLSPSHSFVPASPQAWSVHDQSRDQCMISHMISA